ncbi:MAG: hypothetical protein ABIB79_04085 [archaeon]
MKMNAKNLMVSIVLALFLVSTVAAFTVDGDLATDVEIKVDGVYVDAKTPSVEAGETITVKVYFTALECDTDVTLEVELEGDKVDSKASTKSFDVEEGKTYSKSVDIKVPYELKDEISDDLTLNIELDGDDYKSQIEDIEIRVQRPSYNADIKSITMPQNIEAGETFPVDIVLKNTGYNDLDDLYVTVVIPALGVEKTGYFGDIVSLECSDCDDDCGSNDCEEEYDDCVADCEGDSSCIADCENDLDDCEDDEDDCNEDDCCDEDDEDTVSGRLYLEVPYDAEDGLYTLEVEVTNDDATSSAVKQLVISNDFPNSVIASGLRASVAVGEDAEFDFLVVNPTNKLKVYRVVTESSGDLTSSTRDAVVAVPAGSSKTVTVTASASLEGEHAFDVNVFSGEDLVDTMTFTLDAQGSQVTNPIVVLTVILAIIFLVLLVVLIVLITKKPEKSEEFGESYY